MLVMDALRDAPWDAPWDVLPTAAPVLARASATSGAAGAATAAVRFARPVTPMRPVTPTTPDGTMACDVRPDPVPRPGFAAEPTLAAPDGFASVVAAEGKVRFFTCR